VTLYVAENCTALCAQARSLLNKRGIPFVEKNLRTKDDAEAYKKLTGGNSVPALTIGKTLLSGFEAGQWNSALDLAGYPKTAPFGSRPLQPAVSKPDVSGASEK
jgi:glutaredoxin